MAEKKVKCPVCNSNFELETDLEVGDMIYCSECYADLKISSLNPLRVEEVEYTFADEDEGEDEEYEEEDEEY